MSTITREQIEMYASAADATQTFEMEKGKLICVDPEHMQELARIALASLEAEPVCVIDQANLDYLKSGSDADVWPASRTEMGDVLLYRAAPPVPVSVPDEMDLMTCHLDGVTETYADGWNACRAAMLQGAEPVTTAYKLPFEQWLSQQTGTIDVECGCVMTEVFFHWLRVAYEAGYSPVIPDGWKLVPVEPTEDMIVNGFESEPDESFSDEKEWEEYDAMSGCQQAAHRAKLCWAAMLAAAPQQEVTQALTKGMERYGDAMQELAKKEVK